jgi:hypothetical protein
MSSEHERRGAEVKKQLTAGRNCVEKLVGRRAFDSPDVVVSVHEKGSSADWIAEALKVLHPFADRPLHIDTDPGSHGKL